MFSVVHLDLSLHFRGGQRQVFLLHKGLLDEKKQSFLVTNKEGELYQFCKEQNIQNVIGVKINKNTLAILKRVFLLPKLQSILKEIKPTHIHFHEPDSLIYSLFFEKKYILFETRRVSKPIKNSSIKIKYKRADYHVGVSDSIKNYLESKGLQNVYHIPSSIDLDLFKNVAKQNVLKNKKSKNVLYIGAFSQMKGVDVLLKAIPQTINQFPDFHLHMVGTGELLEEYKNIIKELNITDYVTFYGAVTNTQIFYKEADVVVIPSRRGEGSNGIIKEALASGKTLITSDLQENLEMKKKKKNGIIYKNEDSEDLADKLVLVLNEKIVFSEELLKKSVEKYDYKNMVISYIKLYELDV